MNKIYKLIWNELTSAWIAVAEFVRAKGKKSAIIILTISLSNRLHFFIPESTAGPLPPLPNQLPTQETVIGGNVSIVKSPNLLEINQSSPKAILNWGTFNLGSASTVNFNQPSPSAVILNNILDANPSQIYGQIHANGQIFFSNPNGMYFSPSSSIAVGGLVATTHSISNDDFMTGKYNFSRNNASGSIVNEGHLTANLGGYIALLAPEVRNQGVVSAQLGTVIMAAGETYSLEFKNGTALTNIYVTSSTLKALIDNGEAIYAPGGLVILSAKAANQIQGGVINNTGLIEASGLVDHGGVIRLEASKEITQSGNIKANAASISRGNGGHITLIADLSNSASFVKVAGSISAEGGSLGGNGGFIETSGHKVKIEDGALISTTAPLGKNGEWLLDPVNFLVASSGGDITGSALSSLLSANDVTLQTTTGINSLTNRYGASGSEGNITISDSVNWSANKLTLNASNNIYINSPLYGSGTASLSLLYGQSSETGGDSNYYINKPVNLPSGNNFYTQKGSSGSLITYQVIDNFTSLQSTPVNGNFALGNNISGEYSFDPISNFNGRFDGLGHTISYLTINGNGLFERTGPDSIIQNLNLNANVQGTYKVGGLVGANNGLIFNSSFTGAVSGDFKVGGLVGNNSGVIKSSHINGNINGEIKVGGLVGNNYGGSINNSSITGNTNGFLKVGGISGSDGLINIDNDLRTCIGPIACSSGQSINNNVYGNVTGTYKVGGLHGINLGTIDTNVIRGNVTGVVKVGGLAAVNGLDFSKISELDIALIDSYYDSLGLGSGLKDFAITLYSDSGEGLGLTQGSINNSSIYGNVSGNTKVGGLTSINAGSIYKSNINGNVIGINLVGGLTAVNAGSINQGFINGSVSGQNKVGILSQANFNGSSITNSYQVNTNIEQPIPINLALNEFDPLIKRKSPKKINNDELINYDEIRSNIIVRAKVIVH